MAIPNSSKGITCLVLVEAMFNKKRAMLRRCVSQAHFARMHFGITLIEAVFVYLCICVFAHQTPGNIVFEVLVSLPFRKYMVCMVQNLIQWRGRIRKKISLIALILHCQMGVSKS